MSRILAVLKAHTTGLPADLIDTITNAGGSPVQIWSADGAFFGIVADGDSAVQAALSAHAAVAGATSEPVDRSFDADPAAAELTSAWNTFVSNDYQTSVDNFYSSALDVGELFPPDGCSQGLAEAGDGGDGGSGTNGNGAGPLVAGNDDSAGGAAGLATLAVVHKDRRALVGNIGVAAAYVGGPAGTTAELTPADGADIALLMLHAFDVYYKLAPKAAKLVFEVNIQRATLDLDPATVPQPADKNAPTGAEFEAAEAPWRDAALGKCSLSAGWSGINAMISQASFSTPPDYAYAAFFTNYPAAWMAYTTSKRKIVYQLAATRTGWKPEGLHFVFAHESGHTSGAPDEYAKSKCKATDLAGFSNTANSNCENGGTAAECLMFKNSPNVCAATPGHFGWNDSNGDGVLDPFDSTYST